jgi:hypothetical protein
MITGIVTTQYGDCPFLGSIELYDGYSITDPLLYSEVFGVTGNYTIPNTVEFYNKPVTVVIKNLLGTILYSTTFTFYSYVNGDPIDYEDLNFRIRDITQASCDDSEDDELFCQFYVIKEPCSGRVCVYNTQSSNYTDIYWEFGDKSNRVYGETACHTYFSYGQFEITQTVFRVGGQGIYACCGVILESQFIEEETTCAQIVHIDRFIPEVSFSINPIDPCCNTDCLSPDKPYCINPFDRVEFNPVIIPHNQWCCSEFGTDCTELSTISFDRELLIFNPAANIGQQNALYLYEDTFFEYYSLCIDFVINAPCCGEQPIKFFFEVFNRNPNIIVQSIKDQVTGEQYIPNVEYSLPGGVSVDLKFCYVFGTRKEIQDVEDNLFSELKVNINTCNEEFSESFLLTLDGEANVITETVKVLNCNYTGDADFYPFPLDVRPASASALGLAGMYPDPGVTSSNPFIRVKVICAGVEVLDSGKLPVVVEPEPNYLGTLQNMSTALNTFLAPYNLESYITNYISEQSLLFRYIIPNQPLTGIPCACNRLKIITEYSADLASSYEDTYNSVCCKEETETLGCTFDIAFNTHITTCPARFPPFPTGSTCTNNINNSGRFTVPVFRFDESYSLRFVVATYSNNPDCHGEWGGPTNPKLYADFTYTVIAGFAGKEDAGDFWFFHEDFVTLLQNATQNTGKYTVTGLAYSDNIDGSFDRISYPDNLGVIPINRVRALLMTFSASECQRLRDCEVVMYAYTEWVDNPNTQIPPIAVNTLRTKFVD